MERLTKKYMMLDDMYLPKRSGIIQDIVKKLGEYEDAEENGELLRFPKSEKNGVCEVDKTQNERIEATLTRLKYTIRKMEKDGKEPARVRIGIELFKQLLAYNSSIINKDIKTNNCTVYGLKIDIVDEPMCLELCHIEKVAV